MSLFSPPTNELERLILHNTMWSEIAYWVPVFYSKHSAKEVYMHRRTAQYAQEIWFPENTFPL